MSAVSSLPALRQLNTGQTAPTWTGTEVAAVGGLGSLLVAAGVLFIAYQLWFKPKLDPIYRAKSELSKRERAEYQTLLKANEELKKHINEIACAVRDVGMRASCP